MKSKIGKIALPLLVLIMVAVAIGIIVYPAQAVPVGNVDTKLGLFTGPRDGTGVDDNVFAADIQWLADSGVTKGCNPPTNDLFCPGSIVTREQMAAFLARLWRLVDDGGTELPEELPMPFGDVPATSFAHLDAFVLIRRSISES